MDRCRESMDQMPLSIDGKIFHGLGPRLMKLLIRLADKMSTYRDFHSKNSIGRRSHMGTFDILVVAVVRRLERRPSSNRRKLCYVASLSPMRRGLPTPNCSFVLSIIVYSNSAHIAFKSFGIWWCSLVGHASSWPCARVLQYIAVGATAGIALGSFVYRGPYHTQLSSFLAAALLRPCRVLKRAGLKLFLRLCG